MTSRSVVTVTHRIGDAWSARAAALRPAWLVDEVLQGLRWGLLIVWCGAFAYQVSEVGIPVFRSDLLVWLAALLAAASIGRRAVFSVLVDFLPFAIVLVVYDYLRGIADGLGMPTWWHPQADIDHALGLGHSPTVWLQEHLKHATAGWLDVVVSLCYFSFFFLPYVTAAVMWWRSRADFYRWALRFVSLSLLGFAFFALIPTAPPWAAAHCTGGQVAAHPASASCMYSAGPQPGNLLGAFTTHLPGAHPWVERISARGWNELHLHVAALVINAGQGGADLVAAVPSLHLGGTVLFCLFMWRRVTRRWQPALVLYPLLMTFSLVYSGEHYVTDCLAGGLLAWAVHSAANGIERGRNRSRGADRLDVPPEPTLESTCPPIHPAPPIRPAPPSPPLHPPVPSLPTATTASST